MSNVMHGGDILLFINQGDETTPDWVPIAHATSHDISHSMATIEVSSKETGRHPKIKPGKHGVPQINVSGLATYDGFDYFDLKEKKDANEKIHVKMAGRPSGDTDFFEKTEEDGDRYEVGNGYITELSREHPHDGNSTYSCTISIDGNTTTETVSTT